MVQKREASAVVTSLVVHALILAALFMVQYAVAQQVEDIDIETVFEEDERQAEEFTKELDPNTEIAENIVNIAGGAISDSLGGDASSQKAQREIAESELIEKPDFQVAVGPTAPALLEMGNHLEHGQVNGETGAAVAGYAPAMSRLTNELKRLMEERKLLVVWLFDESDSMKNDQKEIREQFYKVYEELGVVQSQQKSASKGKEILLTAVHSYGKGVTALTSNPTADTNEIKKAIDKIQVDDSGEENMCGAINAMVDEYAKRAARGDRRLVLLIVTDESGDDGDAIDLTLAKVKKSKTPCYILGRESVFGYPYARVRWKDPEFGLTHWLQIRRGPETAEPESLQYDGLHGRWDAQSAGFGPYEQVRLAKESGGIFFVLPSEEENLVTIQHEEQRKYRLDSMREYAPFWISRKDYLVERSKSPFRTTIWNVIVKLNPHRDNELNIREIWYSNDHEKFREDGELYFRRAVRAMKLLNEAVATLKGIEEQRATEDSPRWRANYDLTMAQTLAYRVRLFQYLLAMDQHMKNFPEPKDPKSNRWSLRRIPRMLEPDETQIKQTGVDMQELKKQQHAAEDQFRFVLFEHPGTPWAYRAQYELNQGFGMEFFETFRDERYDQLTVKLPKQ